MPSFRYKAVASNGETLEGEMDAPDRAGVVARLQDLGHTPIRADQIRSRSFLALLNTDVFGERRLSLKEVMLFTRELATLLPAGIPLDRALQLIVELGERRAVSNLVTRVLERIRGGATLADALEAEGSVFPKYYTSMVRAGEAGATLDMVLVRLAEYMERSLAIRGQVRSALIYPAFLLVMSSVSLFVLMWVVLLTRAVMAVSATLEQYWWALLLGVSVIVVLFRAWLRAPDGRRAWDRWVLAIPIIGYLIAGIEVARFGRAMGTLLTNGVPVLSALTLTREMVGNKALENAFADVAVSLRDGHGLTGPLEVLPFFPKLAVQLLRIGEESGQLEEMLFKLADIYEQDTQRLIERLLSLLVPVITVGLGLFIAVIIGSILVALLSANELAF
jgi:general secretion pathway protein F